jgi:glycosyltransferase involved in cell wall biosynthesis
MPSYIAGDRELAAQNGEEAVIDYLLLSKCCHLIHNGSSLARTVLLKVPEMPHTNTHIKATPTQSRLDTRPRVYRMRMRAKRSTDKLKVGFGEKAVSAIVAPDLVARIKSEKAQRKSSPVQYADHPHLAFVVHSFNRKSNIRQIHQGLTRLGNYELIVCDDGSIDGSRDEWESLLQRPNDFLIFSNDLHEIRILDRAIRFTPANIVCLVQDDDEIPAYTGWLDDVLSYFEKFPKLAVVGGFMGFRALSGVSDDVKLWAPRPFEFVQHVNIGPYFLRRQAYLDLGGWDFSFSRVGEPGICFDNEFCLRAWLGGYKVGYKFFSFKGPPGHYTLDGGTVLFSGTKRRLNMRRNHRTLLKTYSEHIETIDRMIKEANNTISLRQDELEVRSIKAKGKTNRFDLI